MSQQAPIGNEVRDKYTAVIGLEVHAQLMTRSKIFSGDPTTFGNPPNTNVSVVSLGHPGTLPVLNKKAVEMAVRMGLACHSEISRWNIFDRKNYFYPDLPKGYQITQDRTPVCKGGRIRIRLNEGDVREIELDRIHLEEDAGKSIHLEGEADTLVDLNRAGVPLIEIVTRPVLRSPEEAGALLSEVRKIVRYLEICDGNMEEGSLRCDANVSVMRREAETLGKKVEIKNMNSIRNVQRAIAFEIERQIREIENGNTVLSETRLFNPESGETVGMRMKEELNDYRYFPDPDLSPFEISEEWLAELRATLPALPEALFDQFVTHYGLPGYDAQVITEHRDVALYFLELCLHTRNYKSASNWVMGPVKAWIKEFGLTADEFPVPGRNLAELIALVDEGKVSHTMASRRLFPALIESPGKSPREVADQLNLLQDSREESLMPVIEEVVKEFPLKVEEYKKGKKGIIAMFMGEVMKRTRGKADPKLASDLLTKKLKEL